MAGPSPRPATPDDVGEILRLVRELADYERSLPEVVATPELVHDLLFGANTPSGAAAAYCHVVDADTPGRLAAMALWFLNASTWLGRHGIYLEDLYVSPEYRGRGYGRALMSTLAAVCVERGYGRLEWWVLDWNAPAIDFYRSLGAGPMDEWTVHRISGPALAALAAGEAPPAR
jgi:GNAT superfamily N-acetyltransferase